MQRGSAQSTPEITVAARRAAVTVTLAGILLGAVASAARAQIPLASDTIHAVPTILGSPADERLRTAQLLGMRDASETMLRSASSLGDGVPSGVRWLMPSVRVVWNDALPYGPNEGALWAGRGTSALVRAGGEVRWGRVRLVLLPELTASQNAAFDFRPSAIAGRSAFASPWWDGRAQIDQPTRFGDRTWRLLSPGQSSLSVSVGGATLGVASENEWWGPGIRNALLLGTDAEGFPHLFARTTHPWRTRIGAIEARAMLGALTPSLYFDSLPRATYRSFSAAAITLRPAIADRLTIGIARTVVAPLARAADAAGHVADAVTTWVPTPVGTAPAPRADAYTSLFARWLSAEDHVEVYGEVAHYLNPRSARELFLAPHEGQALTLGAQVLRPAGAPNRFVRIQAEVSDVEQSIAFRDRLTPNAFYTGLATREGYTYRGRLLGASIGPGGSSQWLAADLLTHDTQLGLFLGRIRWNNDALYEQQDANFFRHDVTAMIGARATVRAPIVDLASSLTWARRDNYLFQNGAANPGGLRTVDVPNVSLTFGVTPRR